MNVAVDAAGRQYHALARDDFGRGAYRDGDAGLHVRIARLTDSPNVAVLESNIGFDDPPMIDDECIGDHRVGYRRAVALALSHAVPDDLAAAEFHLLAVDREILLDVHDQGGVGEPDPIAHGGTEHLRVGLPGNFYGHSNISHDFYLK